MSNEQIPDTLWDMKNKVLTAMQKLTSNYEYHEYKERFEYFGHLCAEYGPKIVKLAKEYKQPEQK